MSDENVEALKRGFGAYNRRDTEGLLEELDPEVELRASLEVMLGGDSTVYRGHEGIRDNLRDVAEFFAEFQIEISDIRDLDERIVAIGKLRGRGKESGAEVETPIGYVVEFKNGKVIRIDDYLEPKEALEAAGLSE
ncbi:MAG: nuclear transport factor 2 family protein [Solirubrobacterales bacterium]